jgi:hypothetical protein
MTTHMDQGLSLAEDIPAKVVLFEARQARSFNAVGFTAVLRFAST